MKASNIILYSAMRDYGHMINKITFEAEDAEGLTKDDFVCENCFYDLSGKKPIEGVLHVEEREGLVTLTTDWFLCRLPFVIKGTGKAEGIVISRETAAKIPLEHGDWFGYHQEDGVNYRLYAPERSFGARPLILYLHGGGGSGDDNEMQLTDTMGPIKLAERCPDMYVMAPQAPGGGMSMEDALKRMRAKGDPFRVILGQDTDNEFDARGWTRWYLAKVAQIIRNMIAEGLVDPRRVYVTGLSMGGCGTLKIMSVAPDLFAAALPVCPSMNGETWPILNQLPNIPTMILASYIDHSTSRHAYILRAVQKLWKEGRKDVEFYLFTEEELKAYGIGTTQGLSARELYAENHNCWILAYHNEMCCLDWLFSHVKGM